MLYQSSKVRLNFVKYSMSLFRYFQKSEKTISEHFEEVSRSQNSELTRAESQEVAQSLKQAKPGK